MTIYIQLVWEIIYDFEQNSSLKRQLQFFEKINDEE